MGLPHVYLGYWVNGSRKMNYKVRFTPQEHLGPKGWERFEGNSLSMSGPFSTLPSTIWQRKSVANTQSNHSKGLLLTAIGGLALTVDIPLIQLAAGNSWSILMMRSGTTFLAAIVIWLVWRSFDRNAPQLIPGRAGLIVAGLYGIGSITFITAVFNTSTANLVFILAFNTVFAALLSWIFLRERPRPADGPGDGC